MIVIDRFFINNWEIYVSYKGKESHITEFHQVYWEDKLSTAVMKQNWVQFIESSLGSLKYWYLMRPTNHWGVDYNFMVCGIVECKVQIAVLQCTRAHDALNKLNAEHKFVNSWWWQWQRIWFWINIQLSPSVQMTLNLTLTYMYPRSRWDFS